MKKLFLLCTAILFLSSCDPHQNVKTIKDDPDIPATITQLAEAKRDLLQKDTTNIVLNESFQDKNYIYDYKIVKQKVEFQRRIELENNTGKSVLVLFIVGLLLGIFIAAAIFTE